VGSSQHLQFGNFFSNGIQGGIIPVAARYALAQKIKGEGNIGIVFIGDGTLGQGVLYETINILSRWRIPLMIVCENNFHAQSTPQQVNLAGDICQRAQAFGIEARAADMSQDTARKPYRQQIYPGEAARNRTMDLSR
jgi:2-oxoisovalerate dehydrogenase E1 component